jgi:hypothetical protein
LDFLKADTKRMIGENVRVKSKIQWRKQEVGYARNEECLPRKDVGSKYYQSRQVLWAENGKTIVEVLPNFSGVHIIPTCLGYWKWNYSI